MAKAIIRSGDAAGNTYFPPTPNIESTPPIRHLGLIGHPLLSPTAQVLILSVVDATGSATLGAIMDALPLHRDPAGAVFALLNAGVLRILTTGVVDEHTLIARAVPPAESCGEEPAPPTPSSDGSAQLPEDVEQVPASDLSPSIFAAQGKGRTAFARINALRKPGIYLIIFGGRVYDGHASWLGRRMSDGRQVPAEPDLIIGIVDTNDNLTVNDARTLERMVWNMLSHGSGLKPNDRPKCPPVDPARYDGLYLFLITALFALRQQGLLFTKIPTRALFAGPRAEPERLGPPRRLNEVPDGKVHELNAQGLHALAAERDDGSWLLLAGSDVRIQVAVSAPADCSFLRAAWLNSGVLEHSGKTYTLTSDTVFPDAGAAAQFVLGSGRKSHSGWRPLEPDAKMSLAS